MGKTDHLSSLSWRGTHFSPRSGCISHYKTRTIWLLFKRLKLYIKTILALRCFSALEIRFCRPYFRCAKSPPPPPPYLLNIALCISHKYLPNLGVKTELPIYNTIVVITTSVPPRFNFCPSIKSHMRPFMKLRGVLRFYRSRLHLIYKELPPSSQRIFCMRCCVYYQE